MKVFLDDMRTPPDGWILVRWPEEVIELLKTGKVKEVSLDHDLADPLVDGQGYCSSRKERTGYDVLLWIEEQVATSDFVPPIIHIHTSNASARKKMEMAVNNIEKLRLISRV
jgi:hypothetical protein